MCKNLTYSKSKMHEKAMLHIGKYIHVCVYKGMYILLSLQSVSARFYPYEEIETDAVFNLDEDSLLTTDEV